MTKTPLLSLLLLFGLSACYYPEPCPQPTMMRYWEWNTEQGVTDVMYFTEVSDSQITNRTFSIAERDSFYIDVSDVIYGGRSDCEIYSQVIRERYDCNDCEYSIFLDKNAGIEDAFESRVNISMLRSDVVFDTIGFNTRNGSFINDTIRTRNFRYVLGTGLFEYETDTFKLMRR